MSNEIVFIKAGQHVGTLDRASKEIFIAERTQFDSWSYVEHDDMYYGYAAGHNVWCAGHQVEKVENPREFVALEKVRLAVLAHLTLHYSDTDIDVETATNLVQHVKGCAALVDLYMFCTSEFDFEEDDFSILVFDALS